MDKMTQKLEELGQAIMEDPRHITWMAAKEAHDADANLQILLVQFNETRDKLVHANVNEMDPDEVTVLSDGLSKLYDEIMAHPLMLGLLGAQEALNGLMQQLNSRIQFFVTGEEPADCGGDCSGCAGCSA